MDTKFYTALEEVNVMEEEIATTGLAILGGLLSWLVGDLDGFLKVLVAFVVIDYITGVMAAFIQQRLDSGVGFHGIARKMVIFMLVAMANILDNELLGHANFIRDALVFFYLGNEGLSILENCVRIGLPFPESLKKRLEGWANEQNEAEESGDEESDSEDSTEGNPESHPQSEGRKIP